MKRMRCLVLEPGYYPYVSMFKNLEDAAAQMMDGPVEITLPFDNVIALVSQRDQTGLRYNREINEESAVSGRTVVCGWNETKPIGLTKAQADRYYRKYLCLEYIEETAIGEMIAPYPNPKNKPLDERFGKKPYWLER